jgi:hypothetical protein
MRLMITCFGLVMPLAISALAFMSSLPSSPRVPTPVRCISGNVLAVIMDGALRTLRSLSGSLLSLRMTRIAPGGGTARHFGVGIFGGPSCSWQMSSPLKALFT